MFSPENGCGRFLALSLTHYRTPGEGGGPFAKRNGEGARVGRMQDGMTDQPFRRGKESALSIVCRGWLGWRDGVPLMRPAPL